MSRYIDADDVRTEIEACITKQEAIDSMDCLPSIDLVRCKECQYYNARYFECECDWASTDHEGGASYSLDRNPDDFCSYGERESDE